MNAELLTTRTSKMMKIPKFQEGLCRFRLQNPLMSIGNVAMRPDVLFGAGLGINIKLQLQL